MVSLTAVRAASNKLPPSSPTVVFVGATSGIGLGAIEALLKHTESPTVIIIGRSSSKFAPTLERLQQLNSSARLTFIEAQVSLLKEVARVCDIIKTQHSTLDLLWLSQGGLARSSFPGLTPEGLNSDFAVNLYSRMLFIHRLAPLLSASTNAPRIVSVLCAGQEGSLNQSDLGLQNPKNWGFKAGNQQCVCLTSIAMRKAAELHPTISFLHTDPGAVRTDVHDKWMAAMSPGLLNSLIKFAMGWILFPLLHALSYTPAEAGEVGLYELTDPKFGVESGRNFFRVNDKAESLPSPKLLDGYAKDGVDSKVWDHLLVTFDKTLA